MYEATFAAMRAFAMASADYTRLLDTIGQRMVALVADGCAVCLLSEDASRVEVVAVHHKDPAVAEAVAPLVMRPVDAASTTLVASVARTGEPVLLASVDAEVLSRHFAPEVGKILSAMDTRSLLFLPLQVPGLTLGTMVLSRQGPGAQPFDEEIVGVGRSLGESAALAISNARLLLSLKRELEERKRAEAEAKRFQALVEHSTDMIAMAGLDGSVAFVNQAGRKLLGIESEDEMTLERFHTAEGMKRKEVIQREGHWEGEGVLRHFRTGELIPTHVSSFLVKDDSDSPIGFATVQRDLRETRKVEQHMRQMQKMEAVGRLAAGVAHDFNNMLSVILSYGSMVIEGLPAGSVLRVEVEEIVNAGRRAARLTQQLLAFSRQQVLEQRIAQLNEIVTGIDRMTRRLLREDVTLRILLDPSIAKVKVDVGQIEQVILNLAVNARDAMASGGTLTIQTGTVTVGPAGGDGSVPPGRYVTLRVSDTGSGMDEATVGRIFEPFFTTKPEGQGTGLGLATVFGIVRQSGGHLSVSSRVGHGTSFTVYLPPCEEEAARSDADDAPGARAPRDQGKETILLVEDEAQVRKLMEGILRRAGYHVLDAPNASAALKASSQHEGPIDLLVTDVIMPKMSGPQLAERFRYGRPNARVLYISGYMDVSVMDPGGREFLRKPFTPEGLLRRVREVLDGRASGESHQRMEMGAR